MQQQDQELREECLYKQLFESQPVCFFCRLPQEMLRCDILLDQTNCQKNICVKCFNKKKDDPCECGHKYSQHYFKDNKVKRALKYNILEKATAHFNRQHKVRRSGENINLEYDLVNLLAYLSLNPSNMRIKAQELDLNIKEAVREKIKNQRTLSNERSTRKKAVYVNRISGHHEELGLQTCGYDRSYQKGINLVLNCFLGNDKTQ